MTVIYTADAGFLPDNQVLFFLYRFRKIFSSQYTTIQLYRYPIFYDVRVQNQQHSPYLPMSIFAFQ